MWMIWGMLIMIVPIMGLAFWGMWHNKQVDKYNERQRQQAAQGNIAAA